MPKPTPVDASDAAAGFVLSSGFERFAQRNRIYRRSLRDPAIRSDRTDRFYRTSREPLTTWHKADGFTRRDCTLRNAAWHVSDLFTEASGGEDRRKGFSDSCAQWLPPSGRSTSPPGCAR